MQVISTLRKRNLVRSVSICGVVLISLTTASVGVVLAQAQQPGPYAPTSPAANPTPMPMATSTSATSSTAGNTPAALPTAAPADVTPVTMPQTEADLRVTLDTLLQEHTYLAGNAIAPVVAGDQAQAAAAQTVLDQNTQQLGQLFGSLYGPEAQQTFLQLWRRHIADYVQYAQAESNHDSAKQDQARQDLLGFAQDMDQFLTTNNPSLAPGTVASGLTMHVQGTTQVIDALEAKDYATAFNLAKQGADMTSDLGDPLASAIAEEMPNQFAASQPAG